MKKLFLQNFDKDLELIGRIIEKEKKQSFNERRAMQIHDDFWNSLNEEQKEKYQKFEMVLGEEDLITEESIYLFAIKKGFAMGYEVAKDIE